MQNYVYEIDYCVIQQIARFFPLFGYLCYRSRLYKVTPTDTLVIALGSYLLLFLLD